MRDTKSLLLLLVSLLLVVVSFVLIWTWGYNFYAKNGVAKPTTVQPATDSAAMAVKVSDSLKQVYAATLKDLDLKLDSTLSNSDSLSNQLDAKLAEFYRLRSEIADILKNKNANNNFAAAKQKIGELQTKVSDLKDKNQIVDKENKKLLDVVNDMVRTDKPPAKNSLAGNMGQNMEPEKMNPVLSAFTAFDLRLAAINNADDKEAETNSAEKTDKLTGAFTVTNFNSALTNAEMMVVIIKPDGKILKGSGWDSGTFNTAGGKKIYSYKFNFTYSRGEAKRLAFSLRSGNLGKGNYTMEVYQNGLMIGKVVKTLS
jgi:membrane-associated HD superfamily phosphohydrolase